MNSLMNLVVCGVIQITLVCAAGLVAAAGAGAEFPAWLHWLRR